MSLISLQGWGQWDKQQQEMLYQRSEVSVSRILVSFGGECIVDVVDPPQAYGSDRNASETSESKDGSARASIPEVSFDLPPAPNEAQLDVPIIYSGYDGMAGLCYLGAAGMLVKIATDRHADPMILNEVAAFESTALESLAENDK